MDVHKGRDHERGRADSLDRTPCVHRLGRVSGDTVALISEAADKSNLTLDPDLDAYYSQDTFNVKIPTLIDSAGMAADLAAVDTRAHQDEIAISQRHDRNHHREPADEPPRRRSRPPRTRPSAPLSSGPLSALTRSVAVQTAALTKASATGAEPPSNAGRASRRMPWP